MKTIQRLVVPLTLAAVTFVLPGVAMTAIGYANAGGLVILAAICAVLATVSVSVRLGLWVSLILGVMAGVGLMLSTFWLPAALFVTLICAGLGATARVGWQNTLLTGPIVVIFAVAESPRMTDRSLLVSAAVLAVAVAAFGLVSTGLAFLISRNRDPKSHTPVSPSRTTAYAILLSVSAFATTSVVVSQDWGQAGGWLIMTPIVVLQPYVQDSWSKALRRAAGTLVGFGIAYGIAVLIPWTPVLILLAIIFLAGALEAKARHLDYAVYAACLTITIVIMDGSQRGLIETDIARLTATVTGVAVALVLMAIAQPLYRRKAEELGLDKY